MTLPVQFLLMALIVVGIIALVRQMSPNAPYLFQGMFRYEADLGWPHGVQEDDGERAWVPRPPPAWDPEEDELAWAATIGQSTIAELDSESQRYPVPTARVKGDVSTAPHHREA